MPVRFLSLICGFGAILSAATVHASEICGASNPDLPRCTLPELPHDRLPLLTCHTLPVENAGQMLRLSRGTSLLDTTAELFTVNVDVSTVTLAQTLAVSEDDHSSANFLDKEYRADGFYFHAVLDLDNIDQANHWENYHIKTPLIDADLSCRAASAK